MDSDEFNPASRPIFQHREDEGGMTFSNLISADHLVGFCNITDDYILEHVRSYLHFEAINLKDCYNITNVSMKALGTGCPHLCRLDLSGCTEISDIGLSAIGQGCPQLQIVILNNCTGVTDESVRTLAKGCPHLQTLDLSSCKARKRCWNT
jgi:F-box and leucine-rich repeat protein 2/20